MTSSFGRMRRRRERVTVNPRVPDRRAATGVAALLILLVVAAHPGRSASLDAATGDGDDRLQQVLRGRQLLVSSGCGDCHGGIGNPAADNWLVGRPQGPLLVGSLRAYPRNLTPDEETGLGGVSERQIFNALRYGLRPGKTPDVEITSPVPGEGNHPVEPNYLSPAMPWVFSRCFTDQQLWDMAAYLKHGVRAVRHEVPDSEAPPDRWASESSPERIGGCELPPFPAEHEELQDEDRREQVLRGRETAAGCGVCHGGGRDPAKEGFLAGVPATGRDPDGPFDFVQEFQVGEFKTRPRNLTPHNTTGLGRFSERQIFNALRFGLRPGETPDVEITSSTPGEGNHPLHPKYLAPPMPWPVFRHMPDQQLWDIAAYLKHGLKPVDHRVQDSEGPPDFWASFYTPENIGPYPPPAFPTERERWPE